MPRLSDVIRRERDEDPYERLHREVSLDAEVEDRERDREDLERHGPVGCVNCGQTSGVRPCPLCGA